MASSNDLIDFDPITYLNQPDGDLHTPSLEISPSLHEWMVNTLPRGHCVSRTSKDSAFVRSWTLWSKKA
jgi:hypothetical protein